MEGVPRIPMLSFPMRRSADNPDLRNKIRKHVHHHYNEDPDAYSQEISTFEHLRAGATHPARDISGCAALKKYFCQLYFLKSRFPMHEGGQAAVSFSWYDAYTDTVHGWKDVEFELSCILYNIGALHSELGAQDARITMDDIKNSCTHFQCAAWAFLQLKNEYQKFFSPDLSVDVLSIMNIICLAQGQECVHEKSLVDNRKFAVTAKIAFQVVEYYQNALRLIDGILKKTNQASDKVVKAAKKWKELVETKIQYYSCLSYMYRGIVAEELEKYGESVTFFKASADKLSEAIKSAKSLEKGEFGAIQETLNFTNDVITTKLTSAEKNNEFIYHEKVPELAAVEMDIKPVSLVKNIPFRFDDPEISGPDIFARLIPMAAHEASSLYSEEKAKILRTYAAKVDEKNEALEKFLLALHLEQLDLHSEDSHVPQELIDCCAALSANPEAVKRLSELMSKLSGMFHDVEHNLKEIQDLLKVEEEKEKEFQVIAGKRPPNNLITELSREVKKFQQAHTVASESNQTLHDAMRVHIVNLQILMKPFQEVLKHIPSVADIEEKDDGAIHEMKRLRAKISEMRIQRETMLGNLRESILGDDITKSLVVKQDEDRDTVFAEELKKHEKITQILDQNLLAQDNIIRAVTEANAAYASTRKATEEVLKKRNAVIHGFVASHDAYNELLLKCTQGIEFYIKLDTNVSKLLQRVRNACKTQEEEREDRTNAIIKQSSPAVPLNENLALRDMSKVAASSRIPPNPVSSYGADHSGVDNTALQQQYEKNLALQQQYEKNLALQQEYEKLERLQHMLAKDTNLSYATKNYNSTMYSVDPNLNNAYGSQISASATYQVPSQPPYYGQPDFSSNTPYGSLPIASSSSGTTSDSSSAYMPSASYSTPVTQFYQSNSVTNPVVTMAYAPNSFGHSQTHTTNSSGSQPYSSIMSANVNAQPVASGSDYSNIPVNAYQVPVETAATSTSYSNNPLLQQYSQQYNATSAQTQQTIPTYGSYPFLQQYTKAPEPAAGYSDSYANPYGKNLAPGQYPSHGIPSAVPPYEQQSYGLNLTASTSQNGSAYMPSQAFTGVASNTIASAPHYSLPAQAAAATNTASATVYPYQYQDYNPNYSATNTAMPNVYNQVGHPQSDASSHQSYSPSVVNPAQVNSATFVANSNNMYPQQQSYGTGHISGSHSSNAEYKQDVAHLPVPPAAANASIAPAEPRKPDIKSNIDLLSDVDLSLPQPPLQPLAGGNASTLVHGGTSIENNANHANLVETSNSSFGPMLNDPASTSAVPATGNNSKTSPSNGLSLKIPTASDVRKPANDPLSDPLALEKFMKDVENLEHSVENFSKKSLNGPTNIDMKWKEVIDTQNAASIKMSISVARCYPMKNRYADILPHDQTRVPLPCTKDDYINASFVREISPVAIPFIATQAPLPATYSDFWHMVWQHFVELIVCLVPDNDLKTHIYWPLERGKDLEFGPLVISLQSKNVKPAFTERIFSITNRVLKSTRVAIHLQFNGWPGNVFPDSPGPLLSLITDVHNYFNQQRSLTRPVVLHCIAGVGKTGVAMVLSAAIREIQYGNTFPDVTSIAGLASEQRKGVMNDKEYLRFTHQCLLYYCQDLLMKRGILSARVSFDEKPKTHTRHPSQDFLTDAVKRIVNTAKAAPTASLDRETNSPASSTSDRGSPVPVHVGLNGHRQSRAELFADVPSSLTNVDVSTFRSTSDVKESDLKRLDFDNRKGALSKSGDMPLDPLSSLDPLWSMKK